MKNPITRRVALINGISGQDGGYLAKHLLQLGYKVIGLSRDLTQANFYQLKHLGIYSLIQLYSFNIYDFIVVKKIIDECKPTEIYDLAGQSSVAQSFSEPKNTYNSIVTSSEHWLKAILESGQTIRFFNTASSDLFGNTESPANECSSLNLLSPYAEAKSTSFEMVRNYRECYGMLTCSGILSNHESQFRPTRFVTQKIIQAAYRIFHGSGETLNLGNLNFSRDWGYSPEYVVAMHLIMQENNSDDYIISTGETFHITKFLEYSFQRFNLHWQDHVALTQDLQRPSDITINATDPTKIALEIGWTADNNMYGVIDRMAEALEYPKSNLFNLALNLPVINSDFIGCQTTPNVES